MTPPDPVADYKRKWAARKPRNVAEEDEQRRDWDRVEAYLDQTGGGVLREIKEYAVPRLKAAERVALQVAIAPPVKTAPGDVGKALGAALLPLQVPDVVVGGVASMVKQGRGISPAGTMRRSLEEGPTSAALDAFGVRTEGAAKRHPLLMGAALMAGDVVLGGADSGLKTGAEKIGLKALPLPDPPDIDPSDFANLAKFALDPAGEKRLADEVVRVVDRHGLAPKQVVPHAETKRQAAQIAEDLGLNPAELLLKPGRLSGAEMLAIRNIVKTNVEAVPTLVRRIEDATLSDSDRRVAQQTLDAIESSNDALLARFVRARSATGRDLNNLKILASGTLDPLTWFSRAKRNLGDKPFTDTIKASIEGMISAGDRAGLVRFVSDLRRPTIANKLITVWKAGLLTGPPTHFANAFGNTTMTLLEGAKDAPAALWDRLLTKITGIHSKDFNVRAALAASARGAQKGVQEAKLVMRGGLMEDMLSKYDQMVEVNFDNKILDVYTKTVFRSLVATDRVFRGVALEKSLAEQARVIGKHTGVSVDALLAQPSDEMVLRAIYDAEVATFRDMTGLARAGSAARRALGPVGEVLLPFTRTPAAVAMRTLEYSPIGFLMSIKGVRELFSKVAARAGTEEILTVQKRTAEELGRASIGTAPILMGYALHRAGLMSGATPKDQNEADVWRQQGRTANSILFPDNKWRSVERISPFGNLMALGANMHALASSPELTAGGKALGAAGSIGTTLTSQSFLKGAQGALDLISDPERSAGRFLQQTAGSVVPAAVGRVARGIDQQVREPVGVAEAVKARIPGLSQGVAPRLDQFGRPIPDGQGVASALLDPFNARQDLRADDPVVAEMVKVGAGIGRPARQPGEETESYRLRQALVGPRTRKAVEQVISSRKYQSVDEAVRRMVLALPNAQNADAERIEMVIGLLSNEKKRELIENAVRRERGSANRAARNAIR